MTEYALKRSVPSLWPKKGAKLLAACPAAWSTITSNSNFMVPSCRLQYILRPKIKWYSCFLTSWQRIMRERVCACICVLYTKCYYFLFCYVESRFQVVCCISLCFLWYLITCCTHTSVNALLHMSIDTIPILKQINSLLSNHSTSVINIMASNTIFKQIQLKSLQRSYRIAHSKGTWHPFY